MNSYRLLGGLTALVLVSSMAAASTEYQASVQQSYAGQKSLERIALAPFACPKNMECAELETALLEQLATHTGAHVVTPAEVSDLMEQANLRNLGDHETRMIIGEGLGVDAFAFVSIPKAEVGVAAPSQNDKWAKIKREVSVKRTDLSLRVVDRQGVSLVQVSGKAEVHDSVRGLPNIATRLFDEMLDRAWQ